MLEKFKVILLSFRKYWILIVAFIILIISFYNLITAIWITVIVIVIYLITDVPSLIFSVKFKKFIKEYKSIDDKTISKLLKKPLKKIQDQMFLMSINQKKKEWLIIFLNKQYIFFNVNTIEAFTKLYNVGLGEKEILEKLINFKVMTRAQVKLIEETLIKNNRLSQRETSVKEYREKQRFNS
ncbi:MAG: hypothetical protein KGD73_08295 [Candidatus Lokiarchaeota archaeon]|nr:hypothetical protein [Candidatus Lokiarchaeota archaeon]